MAQITKPAQYMSGQHVEGGGGGAPKSNNPRQSPEPVLKGLELQGLYPLKDVHAMWIWSGSSQPSCTVVISRGSRSSASKIGLAQVLASYARQYEHHCMSTEPTSNVKYLPSSMSEVSAVPGRDQLGPVISISV